MDDVDDNDYIEMIRLLLVAADRYAMDRLKLLCESILDDLLDVDTVATTLALADQHNCNNLKDVCIEFIATSDEMDAVMATEDYADLKRNFPYVLLDAFEKASKRHRKVSRYGKKPNPEKATLSFEVTDYSTVKDMAVSKFVRSPTLAVGGHNWAIRFYPNGAKKQSPSIMGNRITVYLEFLGKNCKVRAVYDIRLVNQDTGLRESICSSSVPRMFSNNRRFGPQKRVFMCRRTLEWEQSGYIRDDHFTIECVLTVVNEPKVSNATGRSGIEVPPSDISNHLGKLLQDEERFDVNFIVGGEKIAAHKLVVAARSSVFKAELYGEMKEKGAQCLIVEDMQPDVFRALLHFIYNDSLPDMDDVDDNEYIEMIRLLLEAADRYAMDRMKLMCESILDDHLDVDTVATTLALADQHNCNSLMDVCIEFMATSNEMDAVMATEGYADLRRNCPFVLIDAFEKASKLRVESKHR
uniref:BTB domain-containing protein n=1 Tax=Leersia perrieri TaxID=77586 RepID=A0A0D9X5J8_9ORYZ